MKLPSVRGAAKAAGVVLLLLLAVGLLGGTALGARLLLREPLRSVESTTHPTLGRRACLECHAPIAEEWRQSFHHRSLTGPMWSDVRREGYLDTFDTLRKRCVNCHAPANVLDLAQSSQPSGGVTGVECTPNLLREPAGTIPQARSDDPELGVDCVACHVSRRGVLGSGRRPSAAHETASDPRFQDAREASVSLCGVCHAAVVTAWKDSRFFPGGATCLDCHMPPVEAPSVAGGPPRPRRSHRFAADKDDAMLQRAFHASLSISGARASVQIVNDGTGHHLPTGGNWLVVRFSARGEEGQVLRQGKEYFGREEALLLDFWPFAEDSRIPVGEAREASFELPAGHGTVEALVTYHDWHGMRRDLLALREAF